MKRFVFLVSIIIFLTSCEKDKPIPSPIITELNPLKYPDHIFAGDSLSKEISYTKLTPTQFIYLNDSILLDLNKDGVIDFKFRTKGFVSPGTHSIEHVIIPFDQNEIIVSVNYPYNTDTLNFNAKIDNQNFWANKQCLLYSSEFAIGYYSRVNGFWSNKKNKYIGVKLNKDDKTYYGWIRIEIGGVQLSLFEFACTIGY